MSSSKPLDIGPYPNLMSQSYADLTSDIWFTMTFANDAEIFANIVELNEAFVNEWKATSQNPDFITQCMFQAIPTIFSRHSVEKGGNVMGLDKEDRNAIMLLFDIAVKTVDEEAIARPLLRSYGEQMQKFAADKNGLVDWQFMNYADAYQDPLASYGSENVEKIRVAEGGSRRHLPDQGTRRFQDLKSRIRGRRRCTNGCAFWYNRNGSQDCGKPE
jgi:hypothetical protein